jgi:hypothetical protein
LQRSRRSRTNSMNVLVCGSSSAAAPIETLADSDRCCDPRLGRWGSHIPTGSSTCPCSGFAVEHGQARSPDCYRLRDQDGEEVPSRRLPLPIPKQDADVAQRCSRPWLHSLQCVQATRDQIGGLARFGAASRIDRARPLGHYTTTRSARSRRQLSYRLTIAEPSEILRGVARIGATKNARVVLDNRPQVVRPL